MKMEDGPICANTIPTHAAPTATSIAWIFSYMAMTPYSVKMDGSHLSLLLIFA
jgi:hypothetical protein